jgi:predicted acyltransferase
MYTYNATTKSLREPTDPEGLLSTLPAIVTSLFGYWTGLLIQRRGANANTVALVVGLGLVCFAVGWGWGHWFPISKKLWTSSFVLLTAGLAMVLLALCLLKFDVWGWRRLARPFEIVGINAIFVFVASGLLAQLLGIIRIGGTSAHGWLYSRLFTSWITDPKLASLAFALATVAIWWLILWAMSRRGWSVRV